MSKYDQDPLLRGESDDILEYHKRRKPETQYIFDKLERRISFKNNDKGYGLDAEPRSSSGDLLEPLAQPEADSLGEVTFRVIPDVADTWGITLVPDTTPSYKPHKSLWDYYLQGGTALRDGSVRMPNGVIHHPNGTTDNPTRKFPKEDY